MKQGVTDRTLSRVKCIEVSKKSQSILTCPAWYFQLAEEMVRNNSSLKQAALDLNIKLDPDEVVRLGRRKDFQDICRIERNKFHAAIANDPTRTKSAALGMMWELAERLKADGEFEKAALTLDKLSKMEGWSGNEGNINIFSGLTARDIAEARERLAGAANAQHLPKVPAADIQRPN